ncbi:MAG TPA: hypothetical protein VGJ48_14425 [Pyrinomonadaceae bacterium]|jgi:thioredoxin reductase
MRRPSRRDLLTSWVRNYRKLAVGLKLHNHRLPGVFAIGDVQGDNMQRVTPAVCEGLIAFSFVAQVLAE